MFTRIQALKYRSLKFVDQSLGPFHALVGPNASGKSTLLDVLLFVGDLMRGRGDVVETVVKRSADFSKLPWKGLGRSFQLVVEAEIPRQILDRVDEDRRPYSVARYEIAVALDAETNEIGLDRETLWVTKPVAHAMPVERSLFPELIVHPESILLGNQGKGRRRVAINKKPGGNDNYYPDRGNESKYKPSYRLGRTRSALANVPADPAGFPVGTWFRDLLEGGIQMLALDGRKLQQPSPPGLGQRFQLDGSNLPWVVEDLSRDPARYRRWINHLRTALNDVKEVRTVIRENDRHRYIVVEYDNGAVVPSWLVSDGTLRMLALTILAYLPNLSGTFLIEEPENGIHPRALETVIQSLTTIYNHQVLIATHSPIVLNQLEPANILCFAKGPDGATDIVSGDHHPQLQTWKTQQSVDLGTLLASGILS